MEQRATYSSGNGNSQAAPLLSIYEEHNGRRVVLAAVGELDIGTTAELQRALETLRTGAAPEIWLDLTRTTFMDGGGIHALLKLRAGLHAANRRLVVICPPGPVLRLLVLTGLDHELEIRAARTAAPCPT